MTMKPAVAYVRVSSAGQLREGFSIPAQRQICIDYAVAHGMTITAWFEDDETAKSAGRPGFASMVRYLTEHPDHALLVEKTDRLYRNLRDYIDLDTLGVETHLVKEGGRDRGDSDARFMHLIRVGIARKYVENLSEEVKKGMRQKCAEGGWPTWAPLGYRNVTDAAEKKRTGGIVPDPVTAPLVRELFEAAAAGGQSLGSLARLASRIGLHGARGGTIGKQQIANIIAGTVYYGETRWSGQTYRGIYEPLVDRATWELANRNLREGSKQKTLKHAFPYSGALCGSCGGLLSGDMKKGRYAYYSCRCSRQRGVYYAERIIDAAVHDGLRRLVLPRADWESIVEQLESWHVADADRDEVRAGRIRRRLTEIANLEASSYEEKLLGRLTEDRFAAYSAKWRAEETELRAELKVLDAAVTRERLSAAAREPFELLEVVSSQYLHRSPAERGSIVKTCVSNLIVMDGNVSINWASPFNIMAKLGDRQGWLGKVDEFRTAILQLLAA